MASTKDRVWVYVGGGFYPGVPARNLTEAEMKDAEALVPGIKKSGVYVKEEDIPELDPEVREAMPDPVPDAPLPHGVETKDADKLHRIPAGSKDSKD